MKIYLASRWGRKAEMARMSHYLRTWQHEVTSHWVEEPKMDQSEDGNYVEDWRPDAVVASDVAWRDLNAIRRADALVLFTDRSRSGITGGRHCEFGFALGCNMLTVVVGPRTNPFHYLADEHFETVDEFLRWIEDGQKVEEA